MNAFLVFVAGYALGSVPFGVMISRAKGVDLSTVGSGNVGATNVNRALGWTWALLVFVLDVGKGLLPGLLAWQIFTSHQVEWAFAAGLAGVAGHCASPFLRFKGGKGVAAGLGAIMGSTPYIGCGALLVFLVFMAASQMVSLASLAACVSLIPFDLMFNAPKPVMAGHLAMILFIFYRHRANISRIRRGEEPKFRLKN